jgi:acyl-CoA thioesterase
MHTFDNDIAVTLQDDGRYAGNISSNWSINEVPNGGYLMALVAKAMLQAGQIAATPIVTANFLRRCAPGAAAIAVERMSQSRQFERFEARLQQDGEEKIRAFGTFADEKNECILESYQAPPPDMADLSQSVPIPELPGFTIYRHLDIRLDPSCTGWFEGRLSDQSEIRGWIRFRDSRHFDVPSILLAADAFPPAVLSSQGMVAWVPTLEYSVSFRNMPVTDWLKCVFNTRYITCGLLEEDGEIWDADDNLVAISRQTAQYKAQPA